MFSSTITFSFAEMDELKKVKKDLKIWEGNFEKENGRKPGKDDINAKSEVKDMYRNYIDLKKASSGSHATGAKESVCVSMGTPHAAEETPSVTKGAISVTKKTGKVTEEYVSLSNEGANDIRKSDNNNQSHSIPVSILKQEDTEVKADNSAKSVGSDDEKFKSEETSVTDVWGCDLNRASESKHRNAKGLVSTEKKSKGSLFEKIGKRMLSKAMQAPKSLKPPGSTNRGSLAERKNSASKFLSFSKTNCISDPSYGLDENSTPQVFEKALKLSNVKKKPTFVDSCKSDDIASPVTLVSMKSCVKSYSQIPSSVLDEKFDDIDGPWNETGFEKLTSESEKVSCLISHSQSFPSEKEMQDFTSVTETTNGEQTTSISEKTIHFSASDCSTKNENSIGSFSQTQVIDNTEKRTPSSARTFSIRSNTPRTDGPLHKKSDKRSQDEISGSPSFVIPKTSPGCSLTPGKRKLESSVPTSSKRRKIKKSLSGEPLPDVIWDNESIDPFENKVSEKEDSEGTDDESPVKKAPAKKAKLKKSVSTKKPAGVNDNFVMLNMKVKRYRRKGQQVSGPAYKRKMWKQKMSARSQSFGSDKCFKCGEAGHWASKCPGGKNKYNKSNSYTPEEPDLPTPADGESMETSSSAATAEPLPVLPPIVNHEDILNPENIARPELKQRNPPPPPIGPVYQPNADGSAPSTPKEVYKYLKKIGHESFRSGQEEAVMRILSGLSTLLILSTGAGKSLCYQLPAFIYAQKQKCITLVISPLVSLMEDQVSGLPPGIKGACLHTNMTKPQREKIISSLADGNLHFLLISPEALVGGGGFGGVLNSNKLPPIAFACIDEVHCVSEWSHHFRPSYLRVCHVLKERLGVKCILGLTATATLTTAASVAQHLGIEDYRSATIRGTTVPDNLYPSVSLDDNRAEALIQLLQDDRFASCNSIIIYCTRREQTSRLATVIRTQLGDKTKPKKRGQRGRTKKCDIPEPDITHWDAECYHAGLTPSQRKSVQNRFMSGRLRVVVATVAFGMGLDKSDVRAVIHYNMPKTFESYVQEIGRAGRDGEPAQCHVFLDPTDMSELKKHTYGNSIDRHIIKKLVRKLFPRCRCDVEKHIKGGEDNGDSQLCPGHERALPIVTTVSELDIKEEGISTLLCYLELHPKRWVENLQPTYSTCAITCYNGPQQFREIAKKCPPVAAAIALDLKHGVNHNNSRSITFPVVEVSDMMAWDAGIVKREISNLQWNLNLGGRGPSKSGVMVEFSDLAFHFTSHGDLSDDEVDEVVDFLHNRITAQEKTEIKQLNNFYKTLKSVAYRHYYHCSGSIDQKRSDCLKTHLREYFDSQPNINLSNVTKLTFIREDGNSDSDEEATCEHEMQVSMDIRNFIHTYGHEHSLTGRCIARIFQGIASPNFPPEVWGRVRRFWRSHLNVDFNLLRTMATKELIRMK
ncbi:ATP-dependent DNA helicase Q4-like [Lineus longissimus]|uniref:ATP-dependent DNA helicase Q4-like n=1 Tax=Lineus longissimus TaxID=88925 RepID=UPI002B4EFD72